MPHAEHHRPGFTGRLDSNCGERFRGWCSNWCCNVPNGQPPADFEAHIIFDGKLGEKVQGLAQLAGWKFSKIDGDPYLGDGVRCYLTTHSRDREALEKKMRLLVDQAKTFEVPALRMKIEQIVLDVRLMDPSSGRAGA